MNKSDLFKRAWAYQKQQPSKSFSWCLKRSWSKERLNADVKSGAFRAQVNEEIARLMKTQNIGITAAKGEARQIVISKYAEVAA